jgi:Zn-dependent M28 family amino/carboxypeptidase
MLASLSEARLRQWVEKISVPRHFEAQPAENQATAKWLAELFAEWGYEVQRQGAYNNVLALPRRLSPEMILIGAHYDSTPDTPGADDNGSAVAAILGCAEIVAKYAPETPVCFAAFNCEEDGMVGSADFVDQFLPGADFKISQAHILEMVGFASYQPGSQRVPTGLPITLPDKGDFLGILANKNSGGMMDTILTRARTYLPEFNVMALEVVPGAEHLFPVLGRSDHLPFWQQNIPAVMWTDTSEFRNQNYHQPTDTPETLDYGFLLLVTQLLVACACGGEFKG